MAKVWSVCAGKGGVGKTFIASGLGITLSKIGHSVLLIDCDFTGANLHTTLGILPNDKHLFQFFNEKVALANIIQPTNIPHLSFIQGAWDEWQTIDATVKMAKHLINEAKKLPFDFVILDLGPGAQVFQLEVLNNSDEKIIATSPEPTSVEKTYRFLESYICYQLKPDCNQDGFEKLITSLKKYRKENRKGFFSFRNYLADAAGIDTNHFDMINQKPLRLIVNGVRGGLDLNLADSIKSVSQKYFDLKLTVSGCIEYDNAVWQSVRNKEPVLISKPFTPLAGEFLAIAKSLTHNEMHTPNFRAVV